MKHIRKLLHHQTYRDRHGNRQETRTWYITLGGKHHSLSDDLGEAEEKARGLLARLDGGVGLPKEPLLSDLLETVITDYQTNGRPSVDHLPSKKAHLLRVLGDVRATTIETSALRAYQKARLGEGAKPATINIEVAMLRRAYRIAMEDRHLRRVLSPPTFPMLDVDNARRGFFEPHERDAILSHLPEHYRNVFAVAYLTGWRTKSELLTREWRHVDFNAGWLRLDPGETKNRAGRQFPLIHALEAILLAQRAYVDRIQADTGRVIPWVFCDPHGDPIAEYDRVWDKAKEAAGVPHRMAHDFRRTAVRNLERAGVCRSAAMEMVGHKTQVMYSRYAIVDETMLSEGGAKLEAFTSQTNKVVPIAVQK